VTSARRPTHPRRQRLPSSRRHGTTADDIWRRSVPDNGNADFVSYCGANGLREVEFGFDPRRLHWIATPCRNMLFCAGFFRVWYLGAASFMHVLPRFCIELEHDCVGLCSVLRYSLEVQFQRRRARTGLEKIADSPFIVRHRGIRSHHRRLQNCDTPALLETGAERWRRYSMM